MKEIIDYFIKEKHTTPAVANVLAQKLIKYNDIKDGFIECIKTGEYTLTPEEGGYTPIKIHDMQPELDASGVYQFLVTLRDNPDKAEEYIKNNFAQK